MQSKTFRLFISSTFSDFNEERRLLQTYVFPEIKRYCAELNKGYTFQPIDLRWGVSNEAQLDQKTLELCINEVHASKLQPHPNFLIMAGDRYGWVPCPYAIEEDEYKTILSKVVKKEDQALLDQWYQLDNNQIPASYILQERRGDYENYANWAKVEEQLRNILQTAVNLTNLEATAKEKYFDSATEQEVLNGIVKYKDKTPFQVDQLIKDNEAYERLDESHVYGYIRNIKTVEGIVPEADTEFFDKEDLKPRIGDFKKQLRDSIKVGNRLEVDADLTKVNKDENNQSLNYAYESIGTKPDKNSEKNSKFVQCMLGYLKQSIDKFDEHIKDKFDEHIKGEFDEHIKTIEQDKSEALEMESQKTFKEDKAKGFIGREDDLKAIQDYIENDNNQALVICGPSGMGKSALMAAAIQQTENNHKDKQKLVYRFVASTASLSTSVAVLISILKELGIEESIQTIKDESGQDKPEELDQFFARISSHLSNLEEPTIIFIDAVDQFTNQEALTEGHEFVWLPSKLPSNLKIVISALKDDNYPEDSKYLELLKTKISNEKNLHKLAPFNVVHAQEMIHGILKGYGRSITPEQQSYLFEQTHSKQPLYLSIAAQELKHWKSTDNTKAYQPKEEGEEEEEGEGQDLAPTQRKVIDEYLKNLTELYHHHQEMVHRVTSYLHLSDGLSESELLEILSTDTDFIEQIADDTFHANINKELPVVIWARLHTQLKPFLKLENKDGQEAMSFFHREFDSAIAEQRNIQETHKHLISLVFKLMKKHRGSSYKVNRAENRYGKIYIDIVVKYFDKYKLDVNTKAINILDEAGEKLSEIHYWEYLYSLSKWILEDSQQSIQSLTIAFKLLIQRYKDSLKMVEIFEEISRTLIHSYILIGNNYAALDFARHYGNSIQKLYLTDNSKWLCKYIAALIELNTTVILNGRVDDGLNIIQEAIKSYKKTDSKLFLCEKEYLSLIIAASATYSKNSKHDRAIDFSKEAVSLASNNYKTNKDKWGEEYIQSLGMLASVKTNSQAEINDILEVRDKALIVSEEMFNQDNVKYLDSYVDAILGMARTLKCDRYFKGSDYSIIKHNDCKGIDPDKAYYSKLSIEVSLKAKTVLLPLFEKNPILYINQYSEASLIQVESLFNTCQNNKALECAETLLSDIEPFEEFSLVGNLILDIKNKMLRVCAANKDKNNTYGLYEDIYQKLNFRLDSDNVNSVKELLIYLNDSVGVFTYFEDWDACTKYLLRAKEICDPLYQDRPDLWQRIYVDILSNYCGSLYKKLDKKQAYKIAIELNNTLIKHNIKGTFDNRSAEYIINEFQSTDAEYLDKKLKEEQLEYYENMAEEYSKLQHEEYLDELSKTTLSNENIKEVVNQEVDRLGDNADLNHLDVSNITNMGELFLGSQFNGDISKWNVSNVENTTGMFCQSKFNGDISKWNTVGLIDMTGMFIDSVFNGDISSWNVSNVTFMGDLFRFTKFNGNISQWDVSKVTDMGSMFSDSKFNGDISQWNVSKVTNMNDMFENSKFNGDISDWENKPECYQEIRERYIAKLNK